MKGRARVAALIPFALLVFGCAPIAPAPPVPQHPSAAVAPSPAKPLLILVSLDGWRWDYLDRANAPNLRALAARGVRSEGLIPSFPSKTFPNHYTIVTGLYPDHHGIVSNNIWDDGIGETFTMSAKTALDSRWWAGEPLWVTAIKQGHRASSMFWPGSEVEIDGVRPTEWRPFENNYPNSDRVATVLDWASLPDATRPSFITLYFSDVDSAGHQYGPDAPETIATATELDKSIGDLVRGIDARGLTAKTTFVIVSDHGMSQQAVDRKIFLDDYLQLDSVNIVDWSPVAQIFPRQGGMDAEAIYRALHGKHPSLEVYRRAEVPADLHYGSNPRIAPVIALAADGWAITEHARFNRNPTDRRLSGGEHGYGRTRSMHGLFIAAGPEIRRGVVVPLIENIHLYEFMCKLLGLKPAKNDGRAAATSSLFLGSGARLGQVSARTSVSHIPR
jgi:predicted AlkP superfamily pyrophosphatase or phosphodiesterase